MKLYQNNRVVSNGKIFYIASVLKFKLITNKIKIQFLNVLATFQVLHSHVVASGFHTGQCAYVTVWIYWTRDPVSWSYLIGASAAFLPQFSQSDSHSHEFWVLNWETETGEVWLWVMLMAEFQQARLQAAVLGPPEVPCLLPFQRPVWWFSSLDSVRESNILFPISFYFPLSQLRLVSITCNDINKKIKWTKLITNFFKRRCIRVQKGIHLCKTALNTSEKS